MKILKEGILPKPSLTIYRGTCACCGCELEVTGDELENTSVGTKNTLYKCPTKNCVNWMQLHQYVTRG